MPLSSIKNILPQIVILNFVCRTPFVRHNILFFLSKIDIMMKAKIYGGKENA